MGVGAIANMCFKNFNLENLSNVWKPAHLWLALCWNGQALTLDSSTRSPWRSRDGGPRTAMIPAKHPRFNGQNLDAPIRKEPKRKIKKQKKRKKKN